MKHWKRQTYWHDDVALGCIRVVVGSGKFRADVEYHNLSPAAQAEHRGPFKQDVETAEEARRLVEGVAK